MTPEEQDEEIAKIRRALLDRKAPVKVLIVEDVENDATLTLERMRKFGIYAVWAKDTTEVEKELFRFEPWLTFLDLKLHNTSGLNVLEFIKSVQPDSRVVILTGAYEHDSAECKEALKRGAVAVMLKPITDDQVRLIFGTP